MNYSAPNNIDGSIKRILILGGGMTGWTVAAGLANGLRGLNIELIVIEDEDCREQDYYCEASIPSVSAFHKKLGIKEQDIIKKTGASYKLATHYQHWASATQDYYLPFSAHGFMLNRIEFPQYAINRHKQDQSLSYDDYALSAVAAKLGRFQHPSSEDRSLYSTLVYGLHIPCKKYTNYLQAYAMQLNVQLMTGRLAKVIKSPVDDSIESVMIKNASVVNSGITNDRTLAADFFIDCSGSSARLISQEYGIAYINNDSLLANASIAVVTQVSDIFTPASNIITSALNIVTPVSNIVTPASHIGSPSTALSSASAGWYSKTNTQDANELRYFFNTNYTDEEQVMQWLSNVASAPNSPSTISSYSHQANHYQINRHQPGWREKVWQKNCLAIGESAGYLDSLVVGKLHLVQSAVLRLLSLFPDTNDYSENREEYNRLTEIEFQHIADFHALHYKLSKTFDSPFWQLAAATNVSECNQYRLALFKQRGVVPFYENETISTSMWTSFLLGNHIVPLRNDPLVDAMDSDWIANQLEKMKALILSAAQAMPTQSQYLKMLSI